MKLIFAVVNNDDSYSVSTALTKNGFSATKLASTGGFLMAGNTTFLICAEDSSVDDIIEIIRQYSRKRKQFVPISYGTSARLDTGTPDGYPSEVSVGGATVFVTDIQRFEKL